MVILITGASHTGKTLLSQQLLERYHYPYLSIDHIKMGLIRSGNTTLVPSDDEEIEAYLWPIVREIIKTAIENRQNLIVEGCYIPFDWKKDFAEGYLENIKYICLVMTASYIENNFTMIRDNASAIEKRLDDSALSVEGLVEDNRYYLEGCIRNSLEYILIDNIYPCNFSDILPL